METDEEVFVLIADALDQDWSGGGGQLFPAMCEGHGGLAEFELLAGVAHDLEERGNDDDVGVGIRGQLGEKRFAVAIFRGKKFLEQMAAAQVKRGCRIRAAGAGETAFEGIPDKGWGIMKIGGAGTDQERGEGFQQGAGGGLSGFGAGQEFPPSILGAEVGCEELMRDQVFGHEQIGEGKGIRRRGLEELEIANEIFFKALQRQIRRPDRIKVFGRNGGGREMLVKKSPG